jgi:hypothetical protein
MLNNIEYLTAFKASKQGRLEYDNLEQRLASGTYESPFDERRDLCHKYSWAVPTIGALQRIAALGPVVEIGAGTGYWAYLLRELGVDVLAYDIAPAGAPGCKNGWHGDATSWTKVVKGGPERAAYCPERTLFLCWPPYSNPMAYHALKCYQGNTLVYVGEDSYGCTGDEAFHDLLDSEWEREWYSIPSYDYIHDGMQVCTRKIKQAW